MFSFRSLAAAWLLASPVLGEVPTSTLNDSATLTARQVALGTTTFDFSEAGVCRSLLPQGGVQFGTSIWEDFDVDGFLIRFLAANPISSIRSTYVPQV